MYLLINTNFIIPKIVSFNTFEDSMKGLQEETIERTLEYNKKIYVIDENEQNTIYTSDDKYIYSSNFNYKNKKIIYTNEKIHYQDNGYWKKFNILNLNDNIKDNDEKNNNNMKLVIKEKKIENVKLDYENNEKNNNISKNENENKNKNDNEDKKVNKITYNKENEEKINEMIKMIEEVNELYQKELLKIKKLELNLRTYESKLNKLEKKKKDIIINEIIRTQTDYRTWKKIKYGLKDYDNEIEVLKPIEELEESNVTVPILFLSKYNYIEKIQNNESIIKLFDKINHLDLNASDVYENLSNDVVQFSNKYMKLSKELHYEFDDHEWSYLVNEMNLNSTNKLGSNIVSSSSLLE